MKGKIVESQISTDKMTVRQIFEKDPEALNSNDPDKIKESLQGLFKMRKALAKIYHNGTLAEINDHDMDILAPDQAQGFEDGFLFKLIINESPYREVQAFLVNEIMAQ